MKTVHAKILLLGDGAVGKSSIRKRYLGQGFHASHLMTIGADFASKELIIDDYKLISQIWDLAGQVQFKSVRSRFYLGASGALLVFDVTNPNSFKNIRNWLEELVRNCKEKLPIIFIGNKTDLESERIVQKEHAMNYIRQLKGTEYFKDVYLQYVETSALKGTNVSECFEDLARGIVNHAVSVMPMAFRRKPPKKK